MSNKLDDSYRWCWKVVRGSSSSFYRSFFLLKQPARNSIAALYAFSRITDDLGDSAEIGNRDEQRQSKSKALDEWLLRLQSAVATESSCCRTGYQHDDSIQIRQAVTAESRVKAVATISCATENGKLIRSKLHHYEELWPALQDTVRKYGIAPQLLEDIVRGVMMDLDTVRIVDWKELSDYCYHVASAVGLACTRIWNTSNDLPVQAAIDCGIAFQLTNILRDLREDAARGRIYVPRTLLKQFACSENDWLNGRPDGDWQGCVDSLLETAKEHYVKGWLTQKYLGADGRKMFSLMWRSYRALLDEVQGHKSMLWSSYRVRLPHTTRWRLTASHFMPSWYRGLSDPSIASGSVE